LAVSKLTLTLMPAALSALSPLIFDWISAASAVPVA